MTNMTRELIDEPSFRKELATLINRCSLENKSNTPDFILAAYLIDCLKAYEKTKSLNEAWHKNQSN